MIPLLELDQVQVRFGAVQALSGVTLLIHPGERVALIGGNGSGKSTLLRVFHRLIAPSAGAVKTDASVRQAMLFQRPYMLRTTSLNNVALGLWLGGVPWREARAHARLALQRVGLSAMAERGAKTLSGGQQQRLALARAWVLKPGLLLLDEPTASLDPHAKREVEALMDELAQDMTLVFSSHNLGQVKRLANRVIYLEQGRVLADLPTEQFFGGALLQERYPAANLFVKGELS
ncbi:phosphate ABC transporter ATP-binding protein [Rhodoferax sp.]|uniref:ABC transporter ATP-binding protein n=1 Tax=Rhodoferax sp. TaxID=50421 RepID=UPI00275460F1|nr:phosphate ABC transporter ATP-binding protein [Rhodoferax sp.]